MSLYEISVGDSFERPEPGFVFFVEPLALFPPFADELVVLAGVFGETSMFLVSIPLGSGFFSRRGCSS